MDAAVSLRAWRTYCLLVVLFLLVAGGAFIWSKYISMDRAEESHSSEISLQEKQVLGWIPYWDQEAAIASFQRHPDLFDYIVTFSHVLRADCSIDVYPDAKIDPTLIAYAHAQHVKVMVLIANLAIDEEGGTWNADY